MRKRMLMVAFALAIVIFPIYASPVRDSGERPIGIISAMNSELQFLIDTATVARSEEFGGMTFHQGTLNGKKVVLVKGGIGKSLSAACTATLISRYNVRNIIFTGIAGGVQKDTNVLDVVIGTALATHDYGTQTNDGYVWRPGPDNISTIPADPQLVELAFQVATEVANEEQVAVHKGVIVSGDQFIASETYVNFLRDQFDAYATEMEGSSVALVAMKFGIPFVVIRVNSDLADGNAHEAIENFGGRAALISQRIVLKLLDSL